MTTKERLFVVYYLGKAKGNGTLAASMAGYRCPRKLASRLLARPRVVEAVELQLGKAATEAEEVLARLSALARADATDFIAVDSKGSPKLDLAKAKRRGMLVAVKKVKATRIDRGKDEDPLEVVEVELHNPIQTLALLAKYHGLVDRFRAESDGPVKSPGSTSRTSTTGARESTSLRRDERADESIITKLLREWRSEAFRSKSKHSPGGQDGAWAGLDAGGKGQELWGSATEPTTTRWPSRFGDEERSGTTHAPPVDAGVAEERPARYNTHGKRTSPGGESGARSIWIALRPPGSGRKARQKPVREAPSSMTTLYAGPAAVKAEQGAVRSCARWRKPQPEASVGHAAESPPPESSRQFAKARFDLMACRTLAPDEKLLLLALMKWDWADDADRHHPSNATIARVAGISRHRVKRLLAALKARGVVEIREADDNPTWRVVTRTHDRFGNPTPGQPARVWEDAEDGCPGAPPRTPPARTCAVGRVESAPPPGASVRPLLRSSSEESTDRVVRNGSLPLGAEPEGSRAQTEEPLSPEEVRARLRSLVPRIGRRAEEGREGPAMAAPPPPQVDRPDPPVASPTAGSPPPVAVSTVPTPGTATIEAMIRGLPTAPTDGPEKLAEALARSFGSRRDRELYPEFVELARRVASGSVSTDALVGAWCESRGKKVKRPGAVFWSALKGCGRSGPA